MLHLQPVDRRCAVGCADESWTESSSVRNTSRWKLNYTSDYHFSASIPSTEDVKKSKERLKNIKFQSDIKENVPALYKDIGIMIGALLLLCICVYCIFYALLSSH